MEFPVVQPQLCLGLETKLRGNVHYITDDELVYPVGTVIAVHDYALKKQRFIRLSEKGKNLTHLLVSPNKKIIAVAERTEKLPILTLWDPELFRKKKTITLPSEKEIVASEYACIEFSYDSKYIYAVTGPPDSTMYLIKIDKGRIESSARANNINGSGTIVQIAANPNDVNQVALCGDQVLRCLGCVEMVWRQFGYSRVDAASYTSCCWLSQDRLIVGSSRGKIMILEVGEIRGVFQAHELTLINMKAGEGDEAENIINPTYYDNFGADLSPSRECYDIRSIVNFGRGFMFGYLNGNIEIYEKESQSVYKKRGVFRIPDRTIDRDYEEEPEAITTVNTIAVNHSLDRFVVSAVGDMQLWTAKVWSHDASTGLAIMLEPFKYPQHLGPIAGIAVCKWKPLCAIIGAQDRSVTIWNYEKNEVDLRQEFEDDIYSISIHPTGLYAMMGFSDKLRFMTIMIDEIINTKEFNIRCCEKTTFSRLGHLFAATNLNLIHIYATVTFELLYTLKGHNSKITDIDWSYADTILASCGVEGAVYLWDVMKSTRVNETVLKYNPARSVAIVRDGKAAYSVGIDGHIRQFENAIVQRDVELPTDKIGSLILSSQDNLLVATGINGSVYLVQLPLLEKAEYMEYTIHKTAIRTGVLSYNDKYLITGSESGCVCFWKLTFPEALVPKVDLISSNEILISKQILDDKIEEIRNLQLRMNELENEHSYQMKQNDALAASKMRDIHEGYCNAIEELKLKNEQQEGAHIQEINNINNHIAKMKLDHEIFIEKLEANYDEKLIVEYDKFTALDRKFTQVILTSSAEYDKLKKAKEESELAIIEEYTRKLAEKDAAFNELMVINKMQTKDHEMIKQQIEDDADREIYELKESHERELKDEQDRNVRLQSDMSQLKKKYVVTRKELEDLRQKMYIMENEYAQSKNFIHSLEQDIVDLKKEVLERDQTIEDKEKRLFALKSKNQELAKFKFILDFKIKELKSQIEPKERLITEQTTQIKEMTRELENLQKVILGLDLQMEEFREKLNASNNEVKREQRKNRLMKKSLQDIRIDIHQASGFIQNVPMLQTAIRNMYHKYNADKDFEVTQQEDTEAKSEFLRQRDFLERAVSTLHSQATKNTNLLSYDKVRLVDENAALLEETNKLRRNLQSEVVQNRKLNSLVGMSRMSPQRAQAKVNYATATNKEIHKQYLGQLDQKNKTLTAMQDENARLLNKITEMGDLEKEDKTED